MAHLDLDLVADLVTVHNAGSNAIQYPSPKNGVGEKREVNGLMTAPNRNSDMSSKKQMQEFSSPHCRTADDKTRGYDSPEIRFNPSMSSSVSSNRCCNIERAIWTISLSQYIAMANVASGF